MGEKTHINIWFVLKVILSVGLAIFCFGVWPGHLIHTDRAIELYTGNTRPSQWLTSEDTAQQYFSPENSWLSRIKAAIVFDMTVDDEYLNFTLWDGKGKSICTRKIYFSQIVSGGYFDIPINKKLVQGGEYVWTLTLPATFDLQYAVLITDDAAHNAQEDISLVINDLNTPYSAVNMYFYYTYFDKAEIIGGFWFGAFIIWLLLLELTDRAERFYERKGKNEKTK